MEKERSGCGISGIMNEKGVLFSGDIFLKLK